MTLNAAQNMANPPDGSYPVDVSVILICWNSLELTTAAIRTLREHTAGIRYEVIVVDNGSRGDAAAELTRRFADVTVIANSDNLGFAAANNQGLQVARGRYLLLLNSDTEQTENAVGKAVGYMDAHAEVGVLGVAHRNADAEGTYQPSAAAFPSPLTSTRNLLTRWRKSPPHAPHDGLPPECDVDWVTGSFFFIRRTCLEEIGLLDSKRFFVYAEDIDWCFQAQRAGWKIRYWPGVTIRHLGSSSASQVADKTFMIYRNELEFFRKNFHPVPVFLFYLTMSIRLSCSTIYQLVRWLSRRGNWSEVLNRWERQLNFIALRTDRRGLRSGIIAKSS